MMHTMNLKNLLSDQILVITGAGGFIGSCMVRYLNDLGITNLLLVDDFEESDKWKNLLGKNFSELISSKDLFHHLHQKKSQIGAFIHLGACSNTLEKNVDFVLENNYRYSIKLAEFAQDEELPFVYASSAATYGDGTCGFSDQESQLIHLKPLNPYGYSKHLFDLWLFREGVVDKMIGMKYFNVFGPNEYHKNFMSSWIFKTVSEISEKEKVKLFRSTDSQFKDGEQCRDFIYVKDAVAITKILLEAAFQGVGGIFNVGRGEPVTWKTLAETLFQVLNKPTQIEFVDMPENMKGQYQNYTCADMSKFHALVESQGQKYCMQNIKESIREYVQNYILRQVRW